MTTKQRDRLTAREKKLRAIVFNALEEVSKIQEAIAVENGRKIVGKCFVYRNSHSCPSKESDFCNIYAVVTAISDGRFVLKTFQRDANGKIEVDDSAKWGVNGDGTLTSGWNQISADDFSKGILAIEKSVSSYVRNALWEAGL